MSLGTIIWIAVAIYFAVAVIVFIFNLNIGPVTPGLALMRGLLWPFTLMGMIPGERMRMD
jgi:hypothetical protein